MAISRPSITIRTEEDSVVKYCLICTKSTGLLVANPHADSFRKLLEFADVGSAYRDPKYVEVSKRVGNSSIAHLEETGATWHRQCHTAFVSQEQIERVRKRAEKAGASEAGERTKISSCEDDDPSTSKPNKFTRSVSVPLNK